MGAFLLAILYIHLKTLCVICIYKSLKPASDF